MSKIWIGICLAVVAPVTACSETAPPVAAQPDAAALEEPAIRKGETVCTALAGISDYQPVASLGPGFGDSALEMFKVAADPVDYASRPMAVPAPGGEQEIQLAYVLNENDEFLLTACLHPSGGGSTSAVASAGPIGSQGGQHPVVHSVFLADADTDDSEELVLLVGWQIETALGTSGTMFEPHIYDLPGADGAMDRITLQDEALSSGFEGVREGEQVEYPFKEEQDFRARLQELGL